MTVAATALRADSVGNGVGLNHPYDWKIDAESELLVTMIEDATDAETVLVLNTDFTVTGVGNDAGGNVVIDPALASGFSLVILPNVAYSQTAEFTNQNSVPPEEVESALDRMSRQVKQIVETVSRAITIPLSDTDTNANTLATTILGYKTDAEAAQVGAELAETNAETAETDAQTAQSAAEAARDATLAALDGVAFDIEKVTNADSPVTAEVGKFYSVDTSSGAVTINLPSIATAGEPSAVGVSKNTSDANSVTVNRDGTDTIDGATSYSIASSGNVTFRADDTGGIDDWVSAASGGGLAEKKVDAFVAGVDFTAGTSTQITLSFDPGSENAIAITFDGVTQHHSEYSVSGTTVTFTSAIPSGVTDIEARYDVSATFGVPNDTSVTWGKLASSIIGTVADVLAGTASKLVPASVLNTLLAGCSLYMTTATSIPSGAWTTIDFDTEEYDDEGWHDTVTNNSRITVDFDGRVNLIGGGRQNTSSNGNKGVRILRNGTDEIARSSVAGAGSGFSSNLSCSRDIACSDGDYFELQVYGTGGGTVDATTGITGTTFQARRIR